MCSECVAFNVSLRVVRLRVSVDIECIECRLYVIGDSDMCGFD